jgi:hypothetical protein
VTVDPKRRWADLIVDEGFENLAELLSSIHSGKALSQPVRDLIADCVEKNCKPPTKREISKLRELVIVDWITLVTTVSGGNFQTEAAVARAAEIYGLKRSRIFAILKEHQEQATALQKEIAPFISHPTYVLEGE